MRQRWGIEEPREVPGLSDRRFLEEFQAALDHGVMSPLARAVFVKARNRLGGAVQVMNTYADWFEDSPEDSWRLQRDMRTTLHIAEQESEHDA